MLVLERLQAQSLPESLKENAEGIYVRWRKVQMSPCGGSYERTFSRPNRLPLYPPGADIPVALADFRS